MEPVEEEHVTLTKDEQEAIDEMIRRLEKALEEIPMLMALLHQGLHLALEPVKDILEQLKEGEAQTVQESEDD